MLPFTPPPVVPSQFEERIPNPEKMTVCEEVVKGVFEYRELVRDFILWMMQENADGTVQLSSDFSAMVCNIECTTTTTTTTTTTPGTGTTTTSTTSTSTTSTTSTTTAEPTFIVINDFSQANPYPSHRTIVGLPGTITKVVLNLYHLSHTFPKDIDMLLVSPTGEACLVMADCGGSFAVSNLNLALDQDAADALPDATAMVAGTFRPANYNPADTIPSPAPGGPYSSDLSVFNGISPNGVWMLYIYDDQVLDAGTLADWSLTITSA